MFRSMPIQGQIEDAGQNDQQIKEQCHSANHDHHNDRNARAPALGFFPFAAIWGGLDRIF